MASILLGEARGRAPLWRTGLNHNTIAHEYHLIGDTPGKSNLVRDHDHRHALARELGVARRAHFVTLLHAWVQLRSSNDTR